MTEPEQDRRGELLAAALAGDLSPDESREFDALRRADPSVDRELAELGGVVAELDGLRGWTETEMAAPVQEEVSATSSSGSSAPAPAFHAGPRRRRRVSVRAGVGAALAAAACVAIGVVIGATVLPGGGGTPSGPPGTLGAIEHVDFVGEPAGVGLDGDLVAHTWGTEALLTVSGLEAGSYSVVIIDRDGTEHETGGFLASAVPVDCSLNAAVLRDDVVAVAILDARGVSVATAEVPAI